MEVLLNLAAKEMKLN
jgi:CheY-like chemotaxis protein